MSLVGKPSQMTVFDALYSIAAGDGRGEALFGNSFDIARSAYERTLIGAGYPELTLSFPFSDRRGSICSRPTEPCGLGLASRRELASAIRRCSTGSRASAIEASMRAAASSSTRRLAKPSERAFTCSTANTPT